MAHLFTQKPLLMQPTYNSAVMRRVLASFSDFCGHHRVCVMCLQERVCVLLITHPVTNLLLEPVASHSAVVLINRRGHCA